MSFFLRKTSTELIRNFDCIMTKEFGSQQTVHENVFSLKEEDSVWNNTIPFFSKISYLKVIYCSGFCSIVLCLDWCMVAVKMIVKTGNVQNQKVSRKICTEFLWLLGLPLFTSSYSLNTFLCVSWNSLQHFSWICSSSHWKRYANISNISPFFHFQPESHARFIKSRLTWNPWWIYCIQWMNHGKVSE